MACDELTSETDFLLIVNATSMESFHAFTRRVGTSDNNVHNFKSSFAINCSKFESKIPLDLPREED